MAREEDIEASASITDHLLTRPLGHEDTQVTHERLTWRGELASCVVCSWVTPTIPIPSGAIEPIDS